MSDSARTPHDGDVICELNPGLNPSTTPDQGIGIRSTSPRRSKRVRGGFACQRCKNRKQKCDGLQPTCSNCQHGQSDCHYIFSRKPRKAEQARYIKALENRVAELEVSISATGRQNVPDDHWNNSPPGEPVPDSFSAVVRDLALHSSGLYIGGASNLSLGRLLGPVMQARGSERALLSETRQSAPARNASKQIENPTEQIPSPTASQFTRQVERPHFPETASFSRPEIDGLFESYMKHVSIQYPLIHSVKLIEWHNRRMNLTAPFEICVMHLTYAIGALMFKFSGQSSCVNADAHYEAAMENRDIIIQYSDRRSIVYLAMAAFYCLRAPKNPGPWMMIGLAMRFCIALGLHRKSSLCRPGLAVELDKRLFWTCYLFDREITIGTGRPPSISDHDIDAELPLEMHESSVCLEDLFSAAYRDPNTPVNPPTTLTFFLHLLRVKRISSEIQHEIYRVDRDTTPSPAIMDGFLKRLDEWLAMSPAPKEVSSRAQGSDNEVKPSYATLHLKGSYLLQYYANRRFLLFPQISLPVVNQHYLSLCAEACAGVCEAYKNLHDYSTSICYTPQATQRLFLAGLTLIYCIWRAPQHLSRPNYRDAVVSCSIMLYVLTERWGPALKYRKVFERVKRTVFDLIVEENCQANGTIEGVVDAETRAALDSINDDKFGGGAGVDTLQGFTRMINEFTGNISVINEDSNTSWSRRTPVASNDSDGNMFNFEPDMTGIEWDCSNWSTIY